MPNILRSCDFLNSVKYRLCNYDINSFCIGYTPAIYNIGTHYFAGKGVTFDMAKAAQYFQHAADKGFTLAQVSQ